MTRETVPDQPRKGIWKPEKAGEIKEGTYIRIDAPREGKEKFGSTYVIREPDGNELKLPNHEVLMGKMATLKTGTYVWIEYIGKAGKVFSYKVDFDTDVQKTFEHPSTAQIDVMPGILAKIKELKMVSDERLEMIGEVVAGDAERGRFAIGILKNEGKLHKDAVRGWVVS